MRPITPAVAAILAGAAVPIVHLIQLDFASGTVRLNSGLVDISWGGHLWLGGGMFIGLDSIEDATNLEMTEFSGYLKAGEFAPLALQEEYLGRPAKVWLAVLDDAWQITPDPILLLDARMDRMPITNGQDGRVSMICVRRAADWSKKRSDRYTDTVQRLRFSGDGGFRFAGTNINKSVPWGPQ